MLVSLRTVELFCYLRRYESEEDADYGAGNIYKLLVGLGRAEEWDEHESS